MIQIEELAERGVAIFRLAGELDLKEAPGVETRLGARAAGPRPRAIASLQRLEYIDSAGLRALLKAQKQYTASGGKLVLVAPSPTVRHVLEITKVINQFQSYATEEGALAALA